MPSESIYNTLPYTYLIGWSKLDLYYYGRRTAAGCHPSDLFESYFTSSDEVESYLSEYGPPDIVRIRRTFDTIEECCRWECTALRRLDAKNNDRFLNKTNGDSEWIYSGIDAVWMNRLGKNRRIRREHIENYWNMGWAEGRAVDWVWIKTDNKSKRVAEDEVDEYLQNGWECGRELNHRGKLNPMYGKTLSDDHREAISRANTGLKKSKEFCDNLSKRMRGENNPFFNKKGKDNINFKGYYYTPHGVYASVKECLENMPDDCYVNKNSLLSWCRDNQNKLTKISYKKSDYLQKYFSENDIGKSFKELGFDRR